MSFGFLEWVRSDPRRTDHLNEAPNTRLKLAAPVPNGFESRRELRSASILFVIIPAWRRSLSAIR
jgi:hypothetical protein